MLTQRDTCVRMCGCLKHCLCVCVCVCVCVSIGELHGAIAIVLYVRGEAACAEEVNKNKKKGRGMNVSKG